MGLPLAVSFLALTMGGGKAAAEAQRALEESSLTRAIFADGRLWLLSDTGVLSSIADGGVERIKEPIPEPAVDLCVWNDYPTVATSRPDGGVWTLRRRVGGKWDVGRAVQSYGDEFLALGCDGAAPIMLTTRRLLELDDRAAAITLSERIQAGGVTSLLVTHDHAFVGINAGEWGGGLRRIDRRHGKVTVIERNLTGEGCGGPLNAACDPVNGIAAEPWNPDCLALAVGLVHFEPHGRLVEVCGDTVRRLFYSPYGDSPGATTVPQGGESFRSVAFFGLVEAGEALWAVGIDGIYRIDAKGTSRIATLPKFKQIGGIGVSFDLADLILVLTSVNQRRSISGSVPILVAR